MTNAYYTYVYLDKTKSGLFDYGEGVVFTNEPFYVGKGKLNRDVMKHYSNIHLSRRIKKINKEFDIVRVVDGVSEDAATKTEIELIGLIGQRFCKTGPLVNLTDGGDGISGYKFTNEQKKKMSNSRKGEKNCWFGKSLPDYVKQKMSEAARGRKASEETRENMRKAQRNRPPFTEEKKKEISEKIRQCKLGKKRPFMTGNNNPMRRPEVALKMSKMLKGHKVSEQTRRKISQALKGHETSAKTRELRRHAASMRIREKGRFAAERSY
jgi:hypothetical protein